MQALQWMACSDGALVVAKFLSTSTDKAVFSSLLASKTATRGIQGALLMPFFPLALNGVIQSLAIAASPLQAP
jgi:hypothetical protein